MLKWLLGSGKREAARGEDCVWMTRAARLKGIPREAGILSEADRSVLVVAPTGLPLRGVEIPVDAVVLSEDKAWCYVFYAPRTFRRLPIDLDRALDNGYFVDAAIKPNQPIVVKGTGLLLARELGLAIPAQD